jgi:hypothetical protein
MKKIIITIVLLIAVNTIKAQGNLQFNEVKNIEITGTTLPYDPNVFGVPISTIGTITVPTGKVWKIESTSVKENNLFPIYSTSPFVLFLNNHVAYSTNQGTNNQPFVFLPIWLSAGSYQVKISSSAAQLNAIASISAIEFNIAP